MPGFYEGIAWKRLANLQKKSLQAPERTAQGENGDLDPRRIFGSSENGKIFDAETCWC
jgi:hypothetical protein